MPRFLSSVINTVNNWKKQNCIIDIVFSVLSSYILGGFSFFLCYYILSHVQYVSYGQYVRIVSENFWDYILQEYDLDFYDVEWARRACYKLGDLCVSFGWAFLAGYFFLKSMCKRYYCNYVARIILAVLIGCTTGYLAAYGHYPFFYARDYTVLKHSPLKFIYTFIYQYCYTPRSDPVVYFQFRLYSCFHFFSGVFGLFIARMSMLVASKLFISKFSFYFKCMITIFSLSGHPVEGFPQIIKISVFCI